MAAAAATVVEGETGLNVDVFEEFTSVEKSLRTWATQGPPGNQRGSAAALADKLAAAMSTIQGFASEHMGLQKEQAGNAEKLTDLEKYVSSLQATIDELKRDRASQESDIRKEVSVEMAALQKELREMKESSKTELAHLQELLMEREGMWQEDTAVTKQVARLQTEASELQGKLESSCTELTDLRQREAKLAAQVASILAPVSVMCRMRPLESYAQEEDGLPRSALQVEGGEITVEGAGGADSRPRKFLVDRVLEGGQQSQEDVFGSVAPWIENVMGGASSCIMAYGATGSGKTYTVLGSNGRPGIAHHALKRLIDGRSGGEVKLSMVEVYCDQIRDLLAQPASSDLSNGPPALQCSRRDARGRVVLDCAEVVVSEYAKAEETLRLGFRNRAADATLCNDQSSRSHVVLTVEATGHTPGHTGRLVLIDLAGSENIQKSGADEGGKLLTEAKAINRSLSALADVVQAVAKRQTFVPYRNSRLTVLLEETLSVAKICLLVHVSPLHVDVCSTGHSLQFAQRIRENDFGAQQLKKDQEERLVAAQRRNTQENRNLQAQLDEQKKETTLVQQREQDCKQQVAKLTEQLREKMRDLTREQEQRAKLEASSRELKKSATAQSSGVGEANATHQRPERPRSPLLRQQGLPPQAARRVGVASTLRRHQESVDEATPTPNVHIERISALATPTPNVHIERISAPATPTPNAQTSNAGTTPAPKVYESGNATAPPTPDVVRIENRSPSRQPFGDLTNCDDRVLGQGKMKGGKEAAILSAKLPEAAAFETPTKSFGGAADDCIGDVETSEIKPSPPVVQPLQSPSFRLVSAESRSDPLLGIAHLKPALRKVPTNFTERINQQRSLSCPPLSRNNDPKIKFAEQLTEASSPPKWYLDWLENDAAAAASRRAAQVQPLKLRPLSPRRVREVKENEVKEAGFARWR